MDYNFNEIEKKWQDYWRENNIYKVGIDTSKPKFFVLDMFPYPSGAGLHVGHPLGYIASDIYSRYKRLKGFNVLHPMGYDAYGLPAEQYAIQTGTHPAITTEKNIARYREQLDKIGFSYDWTREVRTSDPKYYKWTQWTFIQLFNSWYNKKSNKAESITTLVKAFENQGNAQTEAANSETPVFTAAVWKAKNEKEQQEILMNYRLAYLADTMVNWCSDLGTVLANDEVSEGLSVRGGHPVERKLMKQWSLRITAYADRLLSGLDTIEWSESLKDIQRNWIGKSIGGSMQFDLSGKDEKIEVFTTRPDTIFGATFMVLAPEHELVQHITTPEQKQEVEAYVLKTKNRSERERMAEVKKVSGAFTGAYAINPFTNKEIPVWIADYVLMGYGTGAIMAVPAHDSRDFAFARYFELPIIQVINQIGHEPSDPSGWEESYDSKDGILINSGKFNGLEVKQGILAVVGECERRNIGYGKTNFRLRDAIFSRQRYWGEPFPIYYKDGMPYAMDEKQLPLELPTVDAYLPTASGEPPLARAKDWHTSEGYPIETNTMPGFAGSSGYYLRYMDPQNTGEYFSKEAVGYWENVDLYMGGAEHATGHLIYARFWNMFLFDIGLAVKQEPFKKLINQGMIQGVSKFARILITDHSDNSNLFKTLDFNDNYDFEVSGITQKKITTFILPANFPQRFLSEHRRHIPIEFVDEKTGYITEDSLAKLKKQYLLFEQDNYTIPSEKQLKEIIKAQFEEEFKIIWRDEWDELFLIDRVLLYSEVEKMSKSKFNVVNPDELIEKYGADALRLYEMFLGPLEQSKPWDTQGIEGVFRFIRKLWRLYHNDINELNISDDPATKDELKALHKTIKKIEDDTERFSFNTAVSAFMIGLNELADLKCNKREILEPLTILISSYAPHIAEELWMLLGYNESVVLQQFPVFNESYLIEDTFSYPVSFNGKTRFKIDLPFAMDAKGVEEAVLNSEEAQKWIEGKNIKKIIVVPQRIVNVVIKC